MNLFPRNDSGGSTITEMDEARNRSMLIRSRVERTMRAEIEANAVSYPALLSIDRERKKISDWLKRENWARNHP